mmetsp:Transcript_78535/g.225065  ORF Transcript_78535/g.225065 Transcript_78535/m.225065 type:complete len:106 (+) Transcript_78535:395-712(+)
MIPQPWPREHRQPSREVRGNTRKSIPRAPTNGDGSSRQLRSLVVPRDGQQDLLINLGGTSSCHWALEDLLSRCKIAALLKSNLRMKMPKHQLHLVVVGVAAAVLQ